MAADDPTPQRRPDDQPDQPAVDLAAAEAAGDPSRVEAAGEDQPAASDRRAGRVSRRGLLGLAGAGVAGAAVGVGGTLGVQGLQPRAAAPRRQIEDVIRHAYSPNGKNQAGIITPTPAVTHLIAFTLLPATDSAALARLLRLWSGDIGALMAGRSIPGDVTPEFAQASTSLSVTVGFGPRIFRLPGLADKTPEGFIDIPPMRHDRLQPAWVGGDLVLLVAADDPTTIDYASYALIRDAETFASVRWIQKGEWRGTDASGQSVTGRNLFGQVDGTGNPTAQDLQATVWCTAPDWFVGGTTLVVRRIQMDLDVWHTLTRDRQERVMGRRLSNGAPLTGRDEFDAPDFAAKDAAGNDVIPVDSHVRLANPAQNNGRRILRRGLNYTDDSFAGGTLTRTSGLIFLSFQASIAGQFVPLQRQLDSGDALNEWTHAIGSAVFAIPPGFATGSWLGEALFRG